MKKKRPSKGRLILVDGSHMMYRAYHAFQAHNLTAADGTPTGAVFGTMNSLQQLLKDGPTHIAFVLDGGGKNHRHEMFPEYKAGRPKSPDDMKVQIKHIKKLVRTLGIRAIRRKGEEADDLIGSIAVKAAREGYEVLIVSGDKDFNQLVSKRITIYNQQKRMWITTKVVTTNYGITPKQFVDYLALMGDKVDNIPGIPGCGPVTAVRWLQTFGNIDTLLGSHKKLPKRESELVKAHKAHAIMSRDLARIKTDLPNMPSIDSLKCTGVNQPLLMTLRKKLGFRYGLGAGLKRQSSIPKPSYKPPKGLFGSVKK